MTWQDLWNNYINVEPGLVHVVLRLACAMLVGIVIGLEREYTHRPAGLRTHILVTLGACVVSILGEMLFLHYAALGATPDPARLSAQVISGVGFLGAGTILREGINIKGLTTAAGLWAAAGVGLALGVGFYEAAIVGTFAVFFVMTLLQKMDNKLHRRSRQLEAYIELDGISLGDFLRIIREGDIEISDVQRESAEEHSEGVRAYVATIKGKKRQNHQELMEQVLSIPGVKFVEEL